jgi:hypothetical protein
MVFFEPYNMKLLMLQCMATKAYKQYVNGPRIQEGLKDAMMQS